MCSGNSLLYLICIFLITYDVEHLFMYLFAIHIYCLVRYQFRSLSYLKLGHLFSYFWIRRVLFTFWIRLLTVMPFANMFSQSVAYLFCLHFISLSILIVFKTVSSFLFTEKKILILMKPSLSILSFINCCFVVVSKKS